MREAVSDCTIGGYGIPRGSSVVFSQWIMHRDPRYFHEPERFAPDRWVGGLAKRLPRFALRSFLRRARRRGLTRPPPGGAAGRPRVVYFVDVFANHNDPQIARTLDCFDYPPGVRLLMFDYDPDPTAPDTMTSAHELVTRLTGIWPAMADARIVPP